MKILYFTATGNSLQIAKAFGGELLSIPRLVKAGTYEFTDEKIGIVFPLHAWSAPLFIVDFLKKAKFSTDYLFAIVTYGIYGGAVTNQLKNIAKECGYSFSYINKIKMVDNYLPTFDMEKEKLKEPKKKIEEHLKVIVSDVKNSKKMVKKENLLSRLGLWYMLKRGNKPFSKKQLKIHVIGEGIENYLYVDNKCNQCGLCAKVCPVDNIVMDTENGKIKLSDKCFMCFACIQHCPSHAIHIKGEVNSNRYKNRHISLKEIVEANR